MTKTFHSFLILLALLFTSAMISCVSESDLVPSIGDEYEDGDKAVSLRIINALGNNSDGSSSSIVDGEQVRFNTGNLYLVNSWGGIIRHFEVVNTGGSTLNNATDRVLQGTVIYRPDLEHARGVTILNMPGNLANGSAVLVGNFYHGNSVHTAPLPTTGNISAVRDRLLQIASQYNAWNVNLWGEADLEFSGAINSTTGNAIYEAHIEYFEPTVARFEISAITGTGRIRSFVVDGIFIDQYFQTGSISGSINSASLRTHATGPGTMENIFSSTNPQLSASQFHTGSWLTVNGTAVPNANGDVWGFQVFAAKYSTNTRSTYPRIVIRLRSVVLSETYPAPLDGYHFVTVTGFNENNVRLTGIRALHVYHLADIPFNETHLNSTIDACVTVRLGQWRGQPIYANMPLRQHNPAHGFVCAGFSHTFSFYPATGEPMGGATDKGNVTYQWERSANGATGWSASPLLGNVTATTRYLTLDPDQAAAAADAGLWFRRRVSDGLNPAIYSSPAQLILSERVYDFRESVAIGFHADNNPIHWATRNVDLSTRTGFANHPSDAGMFFQWGSNVGWRSYGERRYWTGTGWSSTEGTWLTRLELALNTHWNYGLGVCPVGWRLPTREEFVSLLANSPLQTGSSTIRGQWLTTEAAAREGLGCQEGRMYGAYPNQIFLPGVGIRESISGIFRPLDAGNGTSIFHSSSQVATNDSTWNLRIANGVNTPNLPDSDVLPRALHFGFSVRCVKIPPAMPRAESRVTAFVSVLYDFQSQPLEAFGIANVIYWQWQVSQSNSTNDSDWTNTTSMLTTNTWTLPADFMHTTLAPNAEGNLYFRAVKTLANGTRVTQEPANVLQIRFIQTTVAGGSSRFLDGFGMTPQGVRYAVMNRARHNNNAANPNTIRVALENLGATSNNGGMGSLFQWGRYADGHQIIGWYNDPATGVTRFTPGQRGTSANSLRSGTFTGGQPALTNPIRPNFIQAGMGDDGDWSIRPANATSEPTNRNLWGAGAGVPSGTIGADNRPTRANTPTSLAGWTHQQHNPCAHLGAGWRVPTHFEWVDMHSGNGTSGAGVGTTETGVNLAGSAARSSGTHNTWTWHDHDNNARGGMVITNPDNGAAVILPHVPARTVNSTIANAGVMGVGAASAYWTSTQNTRVAALQMQFHADQLWIRRPANTLSADTRYRGHGFAVRCVVD